MTDTAFSAASADQDPIEKRKAFVGGLSPETTEEDLNTYFSQFGTVQHSTVKRDLATGMSRCFGFVTFTDSSGLQKLPTVAIHTLKGKKIDPKPAEPRPGEEVCLKVFVGGVDAAMEEDDLKAYFEKFGKVKSLQWPKDRLRDNAKKNFVFVEFEEASTVDALVRNPKHTIGSRQCDVRKAVPAAQKYAAAAAYGYGAAAGGGYGASYSAPYDYSQYAAAAYADPSAYAGYYGAVTGYESSYAGYGDATGYADPSNPYGAAAYDPYSQSAAAAASYPAARGGFRGRGAPGARGAARPAYTRGATRGFHPYGR